MSTSNRDVKIEPAVKIEPVKIEFDAPPPRENGLNVAQRLAVKGEPSPALSCASSNGDVVSPGGSPVDSSTMLIIKGCKRCLIYLMLQKIERRCPLCKGAVFDPVAEMTTARTGGSVGN